jgi:hypothetical protein
MLDWATIASLATAAGTLILAIATFSSTRSANRAARAAERSLLAGLRPVLMSARQEDPPEKVRFGDDHYVRVSDGMATVDEVDGRVYLAMPLRNVASGIAVLHGWDLSADRRSAAEPHAEPSAFRRLQRDLYVPAGGTGYWQGAVREPSDPLHRPLRQAVAERTPISLDLLYGDHEGGQRAVTRFVLTSRAHPEEPEGPVRRSQWFCSVVRHWNLDRHDPR